MMLLKQGYVRGKLEGLRAQSTPGLVPNVPVLSIMPGTMCAANVNIVGMPGVWKKPGRSKLWELRSSPAEAGGGRP